MMVPELRLLLPELDEKGRRLVLGAVARAAGEGRAGVGRQRLTGASWQTVADGAAELASGRYRPAPGPGPQAGRGAGRSSPSLIPGWSPCCWSWWRSERGDPESPLRWTTKTCGTWRGRWAGRHPCAHGGSGGC